MQFQKGPSTGFGVLNNTRINKSEAQAIDKCPALETIKPQEVISANNGNQFMDELLKSCNDEKEAEL